MPQIREYLSSLSSTTNEKLLEITRLNEREFSTFDGSITGGNFEYLHEEVLQVLQSFIGLDPQKVEYVSVLADGLSAVNLASIVSPKPDDETHEAGQRSFRNSPINRIDFIDTGIDGQAYYNFERAPPYEFYKNYLEYKAPTSVATKIEMNYITQAVYTNNSAGNPGARKFFQSLGRGIDFEKAMNSPSPGAKFVHYVPDYPDSSVTLHLASTDPTLYAFSMVNSLGNASAAPLKGIFSQTLPSMSSVPNHAEAIASKSESAAAEQYQAESLRLLEEISLFSEDVLGVIAVSGMSSLCNTNLGRVYCSSITPGVLVYSNGSLFYKSYMKWLANIERYIVLNDPSFGLVPFHVKLKDKLTTRAAVQAELNKVNADFLQKKSNIDLGGENSALRTWKDLFLKQFMPELYSSIENFNSNVGSFQSYASIEAVSENYNGTLAEYARVYAELDALQKQITALNDKRGRLETAGATPEVSPDCATTPQTLNEQSAPVLISSLEQFRPARPGGIQCGDKLVRRPNDFEDLKEYIPYVPLKSDFYTNGGAKFNPKKKINIRQKVDGYKAVSFNHLVRADNSSGFKKRKSKVLVWSCIADLVAEAWAYACEKSNYYPFAVTSGIKGSYKKSGHVAYDNGISVHAYGLAIDIDPFISGHRIGGFFPGVWTGAWTPGIGDNVNLGWSQTVGLGIFPYESKLNKVHFGKTVKDAENFYTVNSPQNGPFFPEAPITMPTKDRRFLGACRETLRLCQPTPRQILLRG